MNACSRRDPEPPLPNFTDVISGILTLAACEGERIPIAKIHSILYEMLPHEMILSGLSFSLKGDIFYSRNVHQAISYLVGCGFLTIVDGSTVAVGRVKPFRTYLSGFLSNSQLQAIHSTSLRYFDRLRRQMN